MHAQPATAAPAAPVISDAEIRHFIDQGFHVAPGLVSPADLERLKRDAADLARGKYPCKALKPLPATMSDRDIQENLLCIHQPHRVSPIMREMIHHPAIAAVLERMIAAHLPHWDGRVKCMQSMLFIKPPGKPGQAWHQDEYYIPTRDRSLCGAWIAIDDATIENGCLWVVPGSHRNGYLFPAQPPTDLDEYDGSNCCYGFDDRTAVPVEVKAGSVVFFNGYLLHKSLKNRSQVYRRALVNHYMNAWSLLPWGDLEPRMKTGEALSVATYDFRAVEQVTGVDPYADKGYVVPDDVYLRTFNKLWQVDSAPAGTARTAKS